ncbi:anti-anti-sigma factor [Actinacidiphila guanduensis]|uniref:Anti-anti-sigma factor n=2 Tax=Actinacidiphila guanduensis TaxID=310781 RepID=A0A1G9Z6K1_9ACTN|nr:anti-anti-sigma factor [Actinacidiphila guanduensis]
MRTLTAHQSDNRATIFLEGEIDLDTAANVTAAVRNCLSHGVVHVDVDLARLTFCDLSGLNAFLTASWALDAGGGRLRLRHPSPAVHRIFDLTNTVFLFDHAGAGPLRSLQPKGDEPPPPTPRGAAASGGQ